MSLVGKRALVTGAASGIGQATAIHLAENGVKVTIGDVNEDGLHKTANIIGANATVCVYDAMDTNSCKQLVEESARNGLDIVCNIAGLLKLGPTLSFDDDEFFKIIQVNLTSVYSICRAALPHLVKTKGAIVNMASTSGLQGVAYSAAYSASKHGVVGLTKSLAIEFASQSVRVNAISPGHVKTPMTETMQIEGDVDWALLTRNAPKLPEGVCDPEDIAKTVAWLASADTNKMTGSIIVIDGGQLAG